MDSMNSKSPLNFKHKLKQKLSDVISSLGGRTVKFIFN